MDGRVELGGKREIGWFGLGAQLDPFEAVIILSVKVDSAEKPVIQQFVSLIHVHS